MRNIRNSLLVLGAFALALLVGSLIYVAYLPKQMATPQIAKRSTEPAMKIAPAVVEVAAPLEQSPLVIHDKGGKFNMVRLSSNSPSPVVPANPYLNK